METQGDPPNWCERMSDYIRRCSHDQIKTVIRIQLMKAAKSQLKKCRFTYFEMKRNNYMQSFEEHTPLHKIISQVFLLVFY